MIKVYSDDLDAKEIVEKAIERSFSKVRSNVSKIFIFISPNDNQYEEIENLLSSRSKVLIFGSLSQKLASLLGLKINVTQRYEHKKNIACLDQGESFNCSEYYVKYSEHKLVEDVSLTKRYFTRFDFMEEWNNHGYGRIGTENDIWSIKQVVKNLSAISLAQCFDKQGNAGEYITLSDFENSSVLYVNREVGLVDGLDWGIVENFLARYRMERLPCVPLILDLPSGCKSVVSPRLDCDQSIINTKPLVELYKSYGVELSLAISTGIDISDDEVTYLNEYYDADGALLSHTINHYFDWGDCYETVLKEAGGSKQWLEEHVKNLDALEYAVSPFHTNKSYSIEALADIGYKGFISGIIHNDPEYLLGTSGQVPFTQKKIVSHSQQCMLHGDCFHRDANSIRAYKESFEAHYQAKKMFGYLDHPFGAYDYGWESEEERLGVHKEFIEHINRFDGVKWMTSVEVLAFVYDKSNITLEIDEDGSLHVTRNSYESKQKISVEYMGEINEY